MTSPLNLLDESTYTDGFPHQEFRRLRTESPVFHQEHPGWPTGYWNVVRHSDVVAISRDAATWSSQPTPFLTPNADPGSDGTSELLLSLDPPDHTRMRLLISRGFTPRRIREMEGKIQATVDRLIDDLTGRSECDMVHDLAVELPLQVIADLVGVPEQDRKQVFAWTETMFGFDADQAPEAAQQALGEMFSYADQLCELRRENPQDDLISALIDAEIDGETLTQLQIDLFFMLLQNAGSETTRNLITSGAVALLEHPEQTAALRADLDGGIDNAVEELLRWVTPVMQFVRRPRVDIEIADQKIAAGDAVVLWYPSANRDADVFDQPDVLDLTRDASDHVAFGAGGPHFCLGASLARIELRIMFRELLTRFEGLALATEVGDLRRVHSNLIDGLAEMPIRWDSLKPSSTSA